MTRNEILQTIDCTDLFCINKTTLDKIVERLAEEKNIDNKYERINQEYERVLRENCRGW